MYSFKTVYCTIICAMRLVISDKWNKTMRTIDMYENNNRNQIQSGHSSASVHKSELNLSICLLMSECNEQLAVANLMVRNLCHCMQTDSVYGMVLCCVRGCK